MPTGAAYRLHLLNVAKQKAAAPNLEAVAELAVSAFAQLALLRLCMTGP